ncbi:hypothetical protein D5H75_35720 [Bailinhaonella thermotolerans]|uniref:SAM-dependent methyltransferase n=2 Tax=Bailinhaonella thermotolerans TaxID=1070861 RepID=A0A3A4A4D7_9ACTN|nr:hypothetical protein D5H75_35720 [Bailinhaonella thermotolerans]
MDTALYGEHGFYRRGERPAHHFRTSVHASDVFAEALLSLLAEVDAALGHPDPFDLVDMGAGGGELVSRLLSLAPAELAVRLRPHGVDLSPRPADLPGRVEWSDTPPDKITGLVVANEWLDNVPLDVAELTPDGPRLLLVDPATGEESLGGPVTGEDAAWLERWWPLRRPGDRAEVGRPRDEAWASVVSRLAAGTAVAIDYAHTSPADRPCHGTLTAYRDGRPAAPVPDGSCDITAHVALDACAAAGEAAGAAETTLTTQRAALMSLGVTGRRPPLDLARTDPRAYLTRLSRAGQEAELIDPHGLGGFGWLAQSVPPR